MTRPAENQQTVEALGRHIDFCDYMSDETRDVLRAALRALAAQASQTQEWKQLAEDMGEALRRLRSWDVMDVQHDGRYWREDVIDPLVARLDGIANKDEATA